MLLTHRRAELLIPPARDTHIQYWQYVEQSTIWPWFYVELVRAGKEDRVASMLMIPNVPALEQVLAELNGSKWLSQALVVTPSEINGSRRWQMEPLSELRVARSRDHKPLGYIYQVEGGGVYTTFAQLSNSDLESSRPIFSAAKHLR
jgi:hypothetical protein